MMGGAYKCIARRCGESLGSGCGACQTCGAPLGRLLRGFSRFVSSFRFGCRLRFIQGRMYYVGSWLLLAPSPTNGNAERSTHNGERRVSTASVKFPFQTSNCLHTTIPYRWRAPRSRRPPRRESRAAEPVSSPQRSSSTDTQAGSCSSADGAVRMSALRGAPVTTHRSGPALCKARTWSSCHTTRAHRCVLSMLSTLFKGDTGRTFLPSWGR